MQTDKELYDLFTSDPEELYVLLNRAFPKKGVEVRTEQQKQVERTSDLTALPLDVNECCHIIENEGRKDENLHSRGMISAGLLLAKYPERRCEVHLVYLARSLDPFADTTSSGRKKKKKSPQPCVNFRPTVHYLDERIREIAKAHPDNPLVSVFFPLLENNLDKLENDFHLHYDKLKQSKDLNEPARGKWLAVFQLWLMRSLGKDKLEEILAMLTEHLPPIEETVWGKELIQIHHDKGKVEGLEQGLEQGLKALKAEIEEYHQLKEKGVLGEEAHRVLVNSAEKKVNEIAARLELAKKKKPSP